MGCVNTFVFVVLSGLVALLTVRGAQVLEMNIVDGDTESTLFRQCVALSKLAYVSLKEISYTPGDDYTCYTPNTAEMSVSDPTWIRVASVVISSTYECGQFASQNNYLMFKWVGSYCYVSKFRSPTSEPQCACDSSDSIFVKMSCQVLSESTASFVAEPFAVVVSWTVVDSCSLVDTYRIDWDSSAGTSGTIYTTDNTSGSERIAGLSGCENVTATLTALDPAGEDLLYSVTSTQETYGDDCNGCDYIAEVGMTTVLKSHQDYGLSDYSTNLNCNYVIEAPEGHTVRIQVQSYSIETGWDFLYIYDGSSDNAARLATLTGAGSNVEFTSSGRYMYLNFFSDGVFPDAGYILLYEAI